MTNVDRAAEGEISLSVDGRIAWLTLNNPRRLNSLTSAMLDQAKTHLERVEKDTSLRTVAFVAEGKDFSAGGDLHSISKFTPLDALAFHDKMNQVARAMRSLSKPVVACINGRALGGGLEIMLSADIRVAEKGSTLGFPELSLGLNAGAGADAVLPWMVGRGRALLLTLTGETLDAKAALDMGLVDVLVEPGESKRWVMDFNAKVSAMTPESVSISKRAINYSFEQLFTHSMDYEAVAFASLNSLPTTKERIKSFLDRTAKS